MKKYILIPVVFLFVLASAFFATGMPKVKIVNNNILSLLPEGKNEVIYVDISKTRQYIKKKFPKTNFKELLKGFLSAKEGGLKVKGEHILRIAGSKIVYAKYHDGYIIIAKPVWHVNMFWRAILSDAENINGYYVKKKSGGYIIMAGGYFFYVKGYKLVLALIETLRKGSGVHFPRHNPWIIYRKNTPNHLLGYRKLSVYFEKGVLKFDFEGTNGLLESLLEHASSADSILKGEIGGIALQGLNFKNAWYSLEKYSKDYGYFSGIGDKLALLREVFSAMDGSLLVALDRVDKSFYYAPLIYHVFIKNNKKARFNKLMEWIFGSPDTVITKNGYKINIVSHKNLPLVVYAQAPYFYFGFDTLKHFSSFHSDSSFIYIDFKKAKEYALDYIDYGVIRSRVFSRKDFEPLIDILLYSRLESIKGYINRSKGFKEFIFVFE